MKEFDIPISDADSPSRIQQPYWPLQLLVALFGIGVVGFHLVSAMKGFPFHRDMHLGAAMHYAATRVDLLNPVIVGFNATGTPTPQELPLWQAAAAAAFKIFGTSNVWANATSLLLFATGLWPLFQLARHYLDERIAWWTLLLLLAQPLIVVMAGEAGTDGLSLALTIWFVYFADQLLRTGAARWWLPSAVFGCLSALSKAPFFFAAGVTCICLLLARSPRSWRAWISLAALGVIVCSAFGLWTKWANSRLDLAEFPHVELRFSHNSDLWQWYFGDWEYRRSLFNWAKGGWAALNCLYGSFALVGLSVVALCLRNNLLGKAWLLACVVTTLVFSHLILVHRHYYLLYSPSIALLGSQAVAFAEDKFGTRATNKQYLFTGTVAALLALSVAQGLIGMKVVLNYDRYPRTVAATVTKYTKPSDKLLMVGGSWGGEELILAGRTGLTLDNTQILEDPRSYARLRELGYNTLVAISESPLLHALQVVDPGNLDKKRGRYDAALTPVTQPWTTLFRSDDLLIKKLPPNP